MGHARSKALPSPLSSGSVQRNGDDAFGQNSVPLGAMESNAAPNGGVQSVLFSLGGSYCVESLFLEPIGPLTVRRNASRLGCRGFHHKITLQMSPGPNGNSRTRNMTSVLVALGRKQTLR